MFNIANEVRTLLKELGLGKMSSIAYDTAWVARLGDIDSELSNQALQWICENQLPDGSWGAKDIYYYHDRVISTLSAMIALTYRGRRAHDKTQIEKGLIALERITSGATKGLAADPHGATVGFEMIVPTLVTEAEKLGIIKQQGDKILGRIRHLRERKMQKLAGQRINKYMTLAFSSEMAGRDNQQMLDIANLQESNGSVGHSPSATAYYALFIKPNDTTALNYLHEYLNPTDGAPNLIPFETFEANWVLWNFALVKSDWNQVAAGEFHRRIDIIKRAWKPGKGIGLSATYSIPDGDDTLISYELLSRFSSTPEINTIFEFEEAEHFCAYPHEAHSSNSVNIHALGTLWQAGFENNAPVISKVINYLQSTRTPAGYWFDKWNLSPFYTTAHAIIVCAGSADYLVSQSVEWIIQNQRPDGSWGWQFSTAEETAYCIQALVIWQEHGGKIQPSTIKKAVSWLSEHTEPPYPPIWMGKGLYSPKLIVRSTILSALALANGGF